MKDKIMYFIIGALIGAIIATACFMILGKNTKGDMPERPDQIQMNGNRTGRPGTDGNMVMPEANTLED